jgi:hypothetical protein
MLSPVSPHLLRVRNGAAAGFAIALFAIAVGLVRALWAIVAGTSLDFAGFLPAIAWYVGGFVIAGGFAGLVWPRQDSPARRRLVFIASMAIVVGVIVCLAAGSPGSWPLSDWLIWLGLSVAFGLAASHGYESVGSAPGPALTAPARPKDPR